MNVALLRSVIACTILFSTAGPSVGHGGDCCADLEARIAELESTHATKGNRQIALTVSGDVSQSILFWDDGAESNVYVVGHNLDQSHFTFSGHAALAPDLRAGFDLTLRLRDTLSSEVSQLDDDSEFGFVIWEAKWYVDSDRVGRLTVGQASRVSDTAPENDLSGTAIASYSGVQDLVGGFFLRRRDGGLSEVVWGDLLDHLNGNTANIIRYDTPALAGLTLSANYGEDDLWDVGAKYEGEARGLQISASIAYTELTDANGLEGSGPELVNSVVVGSIAVLHAPTGLNALIAGGVQSFDERVLDADGVFRSPADARYVYGKLGWKADLSRIGSTAFYGEYGRFEDFVGAGNEGAVVGSLASGGTCAVPGNCRIASAVAEVWGLGVVQELEAAQMQIYLGYRHHSADFKLADRTGANTPAARFDDFQTVVLGSFIEF